MRYLGCFEAQYVNLYVTFRSESSFHFGKRKIPATTTCATHRSLVARALCQVHAAVRFPFEYMGGSSSWSDRLATSSSSDNGGLMVGR